jgi:formylglycine-generating enzyme required for sulfatase activity
VAVVLLATFGTGADRGAAAEPPRATQPSIEKQFESLELAIRDLTADFPRDYRRGSEFLARLDALRQCAGRGDAGVEADLAVLRDEALLANPLLDFDSLVLLKRKRGQLGLPTNHQCNTSLKQKGYDNEIAVLNVAGTLRVPSAANGTRSVPATANGTRRAPAALRTLFRPKDGAFVGEIDLHFRGDRLLFTMPDGRSWQIHEIGVDGRGLRQVSREEPDVDNFDACYLPDGRIVFASTAAVAGVPCWHGKERACSLYLMDADGGHMRQLCFDQDLDLHPAVLPTGQVIYSRWDYTGIMHVYLRPLMVMNPDGSLQRAVYGSNSYYPNSLFFPRGIPNAPGKIAAVLSGYHGPNRMGELVVLDTTKGWHGADGIVLRVGHRSEPVRPVIRDNLIGDSWPKFLHPYPLSDKYFLAAMWPDAKSPWGIYLVDAFDNAVPLAVDPQFDFFEPLPLRPTPAPPAIPDRTDPARDDATVYLHNVYAGPGLNGVPRGSVKRLRIAAYHYGYPGMCGPDKIGRSGPWDAMRILGTVPVQPDGSAAFRVPAATPITVQPLDGEGKALALMRSWYTAMPGEVASCVGCHERPNDVPAARADMAATRPVSDIEPWYGPPRGFDFEREVQPVLDKYCVGCHDGGARDDGRTIADLRASRLRPDYEGLPLTHLGASRLEPELRSLTEKFAPCRREHELLGDRKMRYTPAYDALSPLVRRVNIEDYVGLHVAGEYHADTSELIQMLRKGHHGVRLDREAWDRLITWIDLNGPCHGTWGDVAPIPGGADRRRRELALKYGGPKDNPEAVPVSPPRQVAPIVPPPAPPRAVPPPAPPGWPFDAAEAQRLQNRDRRSRLETQKTLDLGDGVTLRLVRIPAGEFLMGDADGGPDESPRRVAIRRDFWMAATETTNEQFRRFAPKRFSGYFMKRSLNNDGPGIDMDGPQQPAIRVSWTDAAAFCRWLSERSGLQVDLPSEDQWEYACRAGTAGPLNYGNLDADFSRDANVADKAIGRLYTFTGGVVVLQAIPCDARFDDGAIVTAPVGSYRPNAWGLFDMHGNAAEWTRSDWRPNPAGDTHDSRNAPAASQRKIVRGGSFHDRPHRCRSAYRLDYPAWQAVHNVGFRVVCEEAEKSD